VPLVVAVTGHRDLVAAEIPALRERVRSFIAELRREYPERDLVLMTPLAEGADRLAAEEALAAGLPLTVVLPMPRNLYEEDFATAASREQFAGLCAAATDLFELPMTPGNTPASIRGGGPNRAHQYAQLGVFLSAHCHILLALWDGRPSAELGGTAQIVRFHQDDVMPGYTPPASASGLTLTDDESDLVYHVVCSRNRPGGAPAAGLTPLECAWYTRDEQAPRSPTLPPKYRAVFRRAGEFNVDALRHAEAIDREGWPLLAADRAAALPLGLRDIDELFTAADWLAIRYQRRTIAALRAVHAFVLLIGITYVSYTDFTSNRILLFALLALMLAAGAVAYVASRGAWHRKHLDYRALAEGLRVQFYWAASGVTSGQVSKFAHDNFLQMQDTELGWIRNVMRVAGTECDVAASRDAAGLGFAVAEWIGDECSGQLGYFRRRTAERLARSLATERVGRLGLWASAATLLSLLLVGVAIPESARDPMVYAVGCVLLMVGVRKAYATATAEFELIKQYEFMARIFANARRRLDEAVDDEERRRVLKVLGDAALEEHAEWILMHRQRAIDPREVLRLG